MRTAVLLAALPTAVPLACRGAEREVSIDGGRAPLVGTLVEPEGAAHKPAVLLIAGSGPTDRDGNSTLPGVRPATLKLLADGLAKEGLTSLRFDKRGIGASAAAGPGEAEVRFIDYVDDAVAWARFLRARPHVSCVVVVGHSEGALVAAMAALRTSVCGVVELSGAGRAAGAVIREQLRNRLPPEVARRVEATLSALEAGRTVADPPLPSLLRPSVQPYLISWLPIDPAAELAKVRAPVLLVQGGRDRQIFPEDARRLSAAGPGAQVATLPDADHVLKDAPADPAADLTTYADPDRPLDPLLIPTVAAFVKRLGAGH